MSKVQSWTMAGIGAAALVIGALMASGAMTSAQTSTATATLAATTQAATATPAATATATPATTATTPGTTPSTKVSGSNEDPTHEAGESTAREAQEDSGIAATATPSTSG